MKISGIGKYAYFAASETDLEFGELIVGGGSSLKHPTDKEFILRNRSLVRASFQTDHEPVFFFSPLRGVIPPEASVPITVKYTPLSPGTFTCDTFRIQTPGGHHVTVSCRGKAIGPRVSLWKKNLASNLIKANSLNFKDVQVGIMSTRVLVLKNESNVAARFNFMAAPCGVFGIDKVAGVVPPLLDMSITLTFCPENAGNFYRRLFILVQNQSTIYVDILGTGYDNEVRPSPFQQAHVDAYRLRCQHHWGHLSPDGLETLLEEKGDAYFLQGALAKQQMGGDDPKLLTRSGESVLSDVRICDEFFHVATHRSNAIVVSESLLEFFFGSPRATKSLVVTNYTQGKVTCLWRVSETNAFETPTFRIWPTICDIAPGASASFTVSFTPTRGNAYYFAELESHVFFKSNRTFRLVNPQTLTPPWCVVVHASGHSFPTPNSQFLSKVTFETAKPDLCPFPPAYVGDSVYETVSLVNASDTPALFSVVQDPCRVFWVHPPMGRIPPNGFHLVQIRFTPTHPRRYVHRLVTIVNFVTHVTLELTGTGARPQLVCVDNLHTRSPVDTVYIKPTATGLASTRLFYLHNTSRVPLVFRWQVPQALHSTFHLSPLVYRLNGNETAAITCIFSPSQLKQYNQRISVHVKSILNEKPAVSGYPMSQDTSVKLVGVGTSGAISFDPPSIQLPTVLVNSRMAISFHILNSSDCDLIYHLHVIRRRDVAASQSTTNEQGDDLTCQFISFSKPSGTLGARSQQSVELTFQANVAGIFAYKISCAVSSAPVEPSLHAAAAADGTCFHMDVDASASFPSLVIEDLRVLRTPTSTAWTQFQVPALNAFLAAPLTQHEVDFNAESSPDMTTLSSFHMQFTPATEGTPSQVAYVQLRNPGSLVVAYRIYYPSETDVELERWADRGEPTANELRQNIIVDSKLFTISPRSGVLQPHETLVLSLSYSYESLQYDGIHDLSVVLNVSQGKKLTLILHGRTLPVSSPLLFLPSDVCVLHPVQVGQSMRSTYPLAKPCTQQIPVFNCGDQPLQVDIDDSSWSVLNARQFNFPILECRTSRVVVPAHATAFIDVDFCPLQDITYSSELRLYATALHSENTYEQSTTISVVARGYTAPLTFPHMHLSATTGGPPSTSQLLAHSSSSSAALLSHDRVDFGLVCVHTDNVQLVTLTNTSCTATVGFTWDQGHPLVVSKKVLCMPSQGQLLPLQHVLIRIVVRPHIDLMAMAELPLEPPTPVFVQFNSTKRAAKASRLCDDVKRLTATVLENTMFNLIQEIACGEFDLTCLPKQLVFHTPDHDDDNDTVETIQEDRE
ncbi:hypothetical protein B5M09_009150 [Aphanomyces astaci]|uniref:Abnormal spindle-like microcephaly-associated protein ASH domain-containing protein n=1 Tax=Aphanomyces astaci TaxID=112090 RepID=A0A425CU65_APHAT|nr:hypothetical protein B5M09_009150 [Aphanomyces astaci]